MPMPWKKTKVSRFTRIVADLQSPTRGNSLVVETGFPTSLVDLFVKNRERFKKPSAKKKKKRQQQLRVEEGEELVISDPVTLSSSRDLVCYSGPIYANTKGQNLEDFTSFDVSELVSELLPVVVVDDDDRADDVNIKVNGNKKRWTEKEKRLLFVVLKMFMVVVLGLSTKKLAVGITMSAFLLIFLEYIGKHVLCFLKPCSKNVGLVIEPLIGRAYSVFSNSMEQVKKCEDSKNGLIIHEIEQEEDVRGVDTCHLIEAVEMKCSIEEIQVVESSFDMNARVEETRGIESSMDLLTCERRWGCSQTQRKMTVVDVDEDRDGVLVCEKECSRRAKIKRKIIKKLVPKKLRGGKKVKSKEKDPDCSSESSSGLAENELERIEVPEEPENGDKQDLEDKGKALLLQLLEVVEEDEEEGENKRRKRKEVDHGIYSSGMAKVEENAVEERGKIDRKGNSSYLILFLVALVGLIGGRSLSLVLTLASCLTLKLVGKGICVNEPMYKSPASVSS